MKDNDEKEVEILKEESELQSAEKVTEKTSVQHQEKSDSNNEKNSKKSNNSLIIIAVLLIALSACILFVIYTNRGINKGNNNNNNIKTDSNKVYSMYRMSGNSIEDFDLSFLQLENSNKNILYSPLSIKYALGMLSDGASGKSKEQIDAIIGDYKSKAYTNSQNMSFANAMFVKDTYKDSINSSYVDLLSTKYNASVIYDSFTTPDNLNKWVSDKTFNLIENLFDDVSNNNFFLTNALAIDMEWKNVLQATNRASGRFMYSVSYPHEKYFDRIDRLDDTGYHGLKFNDNKVVKSVEVGASINNYDIIKDKGREEMIKTITDGYNAHVASGGETCGIDLDTFVNTYMQEIGENFGRIDVSTDFLFYNDENVKVFAKDLKTYDNTTLQYVGVMPTTDSLENYVKSTNAKALSKLVGKLKPLELSSFEEGKVYKLHAYIPMFKFDYKLSLKDDLQKLGINDVFTKGKADLSNMTSDSETYIDSADHKATIEFSNEGIKAAAATMAGGAGATRCVGYDYIYEIPVEEIDLTFDKPYLFIIRDKDTQEVWFIGTVYEPTEK